MQQDTCIVSRSCAAHGAITPVPAHLLYNAPGRLLPAMPPKHTCDTHWLLRFRRIDRAKQGHHHWVSVRATPRLRARRSGWERLGGGWGTSGGHGDTRRLCQPYQVVAGTLRAALAAAWCALSPVPRLELLHPLSIPSPPQGPGRRRRVPRTRRATNQRCAGHAATLLCRTRRRGVLSANTAMACSW